MLVPALLRGALMCALVAGFGMPLRSDAGAADSACRIAIDPASAVAFPNEEVRLTARHVGGDDAPVVWTVSPGGTIASGSFHASQPGSYLVKAGGERCTSGVSAVLVSQLALDQRHETFVWLQQTFGGADRATRRDGGRFAARADVETESFGIPAAFGIEYDAGSATVPAPSFQATAGLLKTSHFRSYAFVAYQETRVRSGTVSGIGFGMERLPEFFRPSHRWYARAQYFPNQRGTAGGTALRFSTLSYAFGVTPLATRRGAFVSVGLSVDRRIDRIGGASSTRSGLELGVGANR